MKEQGLTDPVGQNLIKLISNVCFSVFVVSVLIFTVVAITYEPPDPWLQSSPAFTKLFTQFQNATFQTDNSVFNTGEDFGSVSNFSLPEIDSPKEKNPNFSSNATTCDDNGFINCSDPRLLIAIKKFNSKFFKTIVFLEYQTPPVNGAKPNECDVAWKFRSKKEKSWRKYRDFRRFRFSTFENCTLFEVRHMGKWHSGFNARRPISKRELPVKSHSPSDLEFNDTIPIIPSEKVFQNGKYLYYSRGGDYCKGMNHYLWSFLCALGEAQYLNRTFVMDLSICLAATYNPTKKDEEGKDFRFYFDFEHLKEEASIVEESDFIHAWKQLDRNKKTKVSVRKVAGYKITPMRLRQERKTIIWRQFDSPEPENYWYRVCEGRAAKQITRPWHALWKSKRLMNIVSAISGRMNWDFDAVHVIRGEKAENKKLWPHLDADTSPDSLLKKLKEMMIPPWRNLYVATNEAFYNFFDRLRSVYKVHLLDDYKELWGEQSEWYNETKALNEDRPVNFDGYMRAAVDTEILFRAKTRVETFYNLTTDCKDGINTC